MKGRIIGNITTGSEVFRFYWTRRIRTVGKTNSLNHGDVLLWRPETFS